MRIEFLKPVEHAYKHLLFRSLEPFLKTGEGSEAPIDTHALKRILFLRPERLGDLLISLPVFDALRIHFPGIKIGLVVSPKNIALVKDDPRIDKLYLYRKGLLKNVRLSREIREDNYDAVVDMICDDSVTALLMSQISAPGKPRIGVWKRLHRKYYDRSFGYRGEFIDGSSHVIPNTMQILKAFGIDSLQESPFSVPFINAKTSETAAHFWNHAYGTNTNSHEVIGFNLSAGASIRLWPTASYLKLIDMLKSHGRDKFLLFAVGADRDRAEEIRAQHPDKVRVIPTGESIIFATALLRRLSLLVSPDTSMIHIARAAQIPVIGLYNDAPKNVAMWHPYLQRDNALISNSPSSIDSIRPEEVCKAVARVLSGIRHRVS